MDIFINNDRRLRAGWRLLVQFILMFLCVGFLLTAVHSIWTTPSRLITTLSSFLGTIASIWLAAVLLDQRSIRDYGLNFNKNWAIDFFAGAGIAGTAISVVFLLEWGMGWIVIERYGWEFTAVPTFSRSLINYLLIMLMVGFYEELLSRGYQILNLAEGLQYGKIGTRGAVFLAVIITSIIFGILHYNNPNASLTSSMNIIVAGIILAIPYVITGSIALSVGLHFSWNFFQGGIWGFPVSGLNFDTPVVQIQQQGNLIWTGGEFGPEAGLMGLIGMAIMLGASYVYITKTGHELTVANLFHEEQQAAENSDEQAV